jgi:deoxyribodipyrimidine photo-lyase
LVLAKVARADTIVIMNQPLIIYWSRRDFRLHDNPALYHAIERSHKTGKQMLSLFVLEDYMTEGDPKFQFGYPQRVALSKMLPEYAKNFDQFSIVRGKAGDLFEKLSKDHELEIHVGEDVHPDFYKQIKKIREAGVTIIVHQDQMTISRDLRSGSGRWYSVFTPCKKAAWQDFLDTPVTPLAHPSKSNPANTSVLEKFDLVTVSEVEILQSCNNNWSIQYGDTVVDLSALIRPPDLSQWYWSETEALSKFDHYLASGDLGDYKLNRDSLELDTKGDGKTSKMSLALAWGLISARTLKNKILHHYDGQDFGDLYGTANIGALTYLSELVWREFYKYVLYHQPTMLNEEFQTKFRTIKWVQGAEAKLRFEAWITGKTGYPAVDAAMHQLAQTGWMHNRARMMVASILTKNLGIDWRWGQEYFRAILIDLDEASNNGGWQWGASTGTDPKPIRIFNPYLQAENYDKSGAYQAKWLPTDYDRLSPPLVEHKTARAEALKRYGLASHAPARDY